jgi:hypothetical protein
MARFQVDNIVQTIEHLLKAAGQPSATLSRGGNNNNQIIQTPVLTLEERNTEAYEQKQQEQLRADKLAAADDISMNDDMNDGTLLSKEEDLSEFLHDEEEDSGQEVLVIPDPNQSTISLESRRKRLGGLFYHKRKQFLNAATIISRGRVEAEKSIKSERKFLHGIEKLARFWTLRTLNTDVNSTKGVSMNPFQTGLSAGSISSYPSIMIDYRLGTRK